MKKILTFSYYLSYILGALIIALIISGLIMLILSLIFGPKVIVFEKEYPVIIAEITKYNAVEGQTDRTPTITASGKIVNQYTAACPSYLPFGTWIEVDNRHYRCEDRMALRFRETNFDLISDTEKEARNFGRKSLAVKIIN